MYIPQLWVENAGLATIIGMVFISAYQWGHEHHVMAICLQIVAACF